MLTLFFVVAVTAVSRGQTLLHTAAFPKLDNSPVCVCQCVFVYPPFIYIDQLNLHFRHELWRPSGERAHNAVDSGRYFFCLIAIKAHFSKASTLKLHCCAFDALIKKVSFFLCIINVLERKKKMNEKQL